jgi:hypothetical protein
MAQKSISTEFSPANTAKAVEYLTATPQALVSLSALFAPEALYQPLRAGDRSFMEILAHIVNCDERTSDSIYAALLLKEPLVLDIHPERDWGKLLHYEQSNAAELLAYFSFRRKTLLRILNGLSEAQWARAIQEAGKQRKETVYLLARMQSLHEVHHLAEIESFSGKPLPE